MRNAGVGSSVDWVRAIQRSGDISRSELISLINIAITEQM